MRVCKANGLGYWSTSRRQHDDDAIRPENESIETCRDQERGWQAALSTLQVRSGKCKKRVRGIL
jgi:hypothetical protein